MIKYPNQQKSFTFLVILESEKKTKFSDFKSKEKTQLVITWSL